ncbi:MAG: histidine triad nucleotide-binding protein [SAR202 cluster bacterium]|nr:histidine triad nucleotide-binding protein [SAR202 cluster bacterium]
MSNTDPGCIFCRIVAGQIPSTQVYRDDRALVFNDIHPVAPFHMLVVPIKHITFLAAAPEATEPVLGHLLRVAATVASQKGIEAAGYRLVVNQGPNAGQEVDHLHVHVIGGRRLGRLG